MSEEEAVVAAEEEEQQETGGPTKLDRFETPNRLVKDEDTASDTFAQFVAEPFERGYGHTIGNTLRRVLLSSLEGAAITSVRIAGVQFDFDARMLPAHPCQDVEQEAVTGGD